ncbi:MAG: hypothetical protein IPM54_01170 [Polyangiaceae bacterium]|nr:hypothetical protein [Polyangiaceae bacterium]
MAYFFFHHPLDSRKGIPGRYAFSAIAAIASDRTTMASVPIRACIDGFADNHAGPNIDPCPFASPLPLIHSFCRIDRRGGKYYVPDTDRILSFVVSPGDTIVYGHLRTRDSRPKALFVDTALVVASAPSLPTETTANNKHAIVCDERMVRALGCTSLTWQQFIVSDVWRFNLADADQRGTHAHTRIPGHRVIIGSASPSADAAAALVARTTSFVSLVDETSARPQPPDLLADAPRELIDKLTAWLAGNDRMCRGMKPPSPLPDDLGLAIYDAARASSGRGGRHSGFVAIPPLVRPANLHV